MAKTASSESRSQTYLTKRKRIGWSIDFNSWPNYTVYGIIPRPLCKILLNDVSKMFSCWERWWIDVDGASHTFSATAAIFSGVCTVFGFSRFGFFHFFHKITNIRSWRCFSFSKIRTRFLLTFCNITMIFKAMSQYFPALFKPIHNHIRSAGG